MEAISKLNRKAVITSLSAVAVLLVVLSGIYLYRINTQNAVEILASRKQLINILVAGSNSYENNKHRFYAIVSINPETGKTGMTFLPPNMKIAVDSRGKSLKKIEEIDIDSFNKIKRSLNIDIKLSIPFYIELYSPDLIRLVDIMEGIDLYVLDQKIKIDGINPGQNYFDGEKIVKYINQVEGNSIFEKYDRIQDILFTLYFNRKKYHRFATDELMTESVKKIRTNILEKEILSLFKYLYKCEQIFSIVVPGRVLDDGLYHVDDVSFKIYEKEFLAPLLLKEKGETGIKIKILNGTNVPGLAKRMRNILMREGLSVVEFGTSPYRDMEHSIIINRSGDSEKVMRISELSGINRIYHVIDSTVLYNSLIIIGKDYIK